MDKQHNRWEYPLWVYPGASSQWDMLGIPQVAPFKEKLDFRVKCRFACQKTTKMFTMTLTVVTNEEGLRFNTVYD